MDELNTKNIDALKQEIVELVTEHWHTHQKVYLLSNLGQTLMRRGFDLQAILAGRKFMNYISTELKDKIIVFPSPNNPLKIGVVPANVEVTESTEAIFSPPDNRHGGDPKIPTFAPAFWAAFTRPIPTGRVRTLSLSPKIQFQEVSETAATQSGKRTVSSDFIVSAETSDSGDYRKRVYENIQRWLVENTIDESAVLARSSTTERATTEERTRSSLLEHLLSTLTDEEMRRISLPLDIVARLSKA